MARPSIPEEVQRLLPLTPAVFFILFALAEGEKHGYAVMKSVTELSAGKFRMGPGTLYTTVQRLLEWELIEEAQREGEPAEHESRRRYYKLTRRGEMALRAEIDRMESVVRLARGKKLATTAEWGEMTKTLRRSCDLYGVLLCAYPRDFRQRFGNEMVMTFSEEVGDEWERCHFVGVVRVWWRALWELASVAVVLQLQRSIVVAVIVSSLGSSALFVTVLRVTAGHCSK
jgi:DNA-binding PadR family transcriptional regulator